MSTTAELIDRSNASSLEPANTALDSAVQSGAAGAPEIRLIQGTVIGVSSVRSPVGGDGPSFKEMQVREASPASCAVT